MLVLHANPKAHRVGLRVRGARLDLPWPRRCAMETLGDFDEAPPMAPSQQQLRGQA